MKRPKLTDQSAAARFYQIAAIERALAEKARELAETAAVLKELKEDHEMLIRELRAAARDEGPLPLPLFEKPEDRS